VLEPAHAILRNNGYRQKVFVPAVHKCHQAEETFSTITPHDLRHTAASLAVRIYAYEKCRS
jgi:integrase